MKKIFALVAMILLASCQPASVSIAPTFPPFPTMTPGQVLAGVLPTRAFNPNSPLSNPATAIAFSNRATPTPDFGACPAVGGNATLATSRPRTRDEATQAMIRFLQEGGRFDELRRRLQNDWFALGDGAELRNDTDLTGEGTPEIILSYNAEGLGQLLVIGCVDGLYQILYQLLSDRPQPPTLIWLGEMNNEIPAELVVSRVACGGSEDCRYDTVLLRWDGVLSRLVNALDVVLLSDNLPQVRDMDNDDVAELVVELTDRGTSATGPLRTGVNIYDWNGSVYALSIIQFDAPRYLIQIIHEGDRAFSQYQFEQAAITYATALEVQDTRFWFNDERDILQAYALYRLILTYALLGDARVSDVFLRLSESFPLTADIPLEELPVYAVMAYRFADSYQQSGDLHTACVDTLQIATERPQALTLLNRYGSRSPVYTQLDLCPF